jgi:glycosyltransferase involved in cell wall biosynthesis
VKILLLVHDYLPEHVGGTEVHAHRLGRELARRGHAVSALFTERDLSRREGQLALGELEGVRTLELVHQREYADVTETWLQPMARRAFEAVLAAERPDVVHVHHLGPWGPGALASARAAGARVVFTAHDFGALCDEGRLLAADLGPCRAPGVCGDCLRRHPRRDPRLDLEHAARLRLMAMRELLAGADRLIAPSRFAAELLGAHGFARERILVLAPGVEGPRPAARPPRAAGLPLRIGFAGGLYPAKGAHVLIEAARLLAAGGARFEVALHGPLEWFPDYVAGLRSRAEHLPVRFAGRFAPERVDQVYAGFDVLVAPSVWYENAPLVVLDAQRLRLPVVAAGHGGLAELVAHGRDGLHFRPGDAADLARVLAGLAADRALLSRLAENAPAPLELARVADRLERIYAEPGAEPGGGASGPGLVH